MVWQARSIHSIRPLILATSLANLCRRRECRESNASDQRGPSFHWRAIWQVQDFPELSFPAHVTPAQDFAKHASQCKPPQQVFALLQEPMGGCLNTCVELRIMNAPEARVWYKHRLGLPNIGSGRGIRGVRATPWRHLSAPSTFSRRRRLLASSAVSKS